jgi:hypothetical protein
MADDRNNKVKSITHGAWREGQKIVIRYWLSGICYLMSACPVECLPNEIPSRYFIGVKPISLGSSDL